MLRDQPTPVRGTLRNSPGDPSRGLSHGLSRGFTLIELLVAIFIMSLLAVLSWRGIDGMARAQESSRERADYVATLQTALAQWQTDLDQMLPTAQTSAIDYNGQVLRITRRYSDTQLRVVGWTRRDIDGQTRWLRWQSDPLSSRTELVNAWAQAAQWGQNPGDAERAREVTVASIDDWQIFYYRDDAWSNPQSSAAGGLAPSANPGVTPTFAVTPVPDGVRLVLKLSQGQALAGTLTRDWVRPNLGGGKT
jgi:general secretion pathway protein J